MHNIFTRLKVFKIVYSNALQGWQTPPRAAALLSASENAVGLCHNDKVSAATVAEVYLESAGKTVLPQNQIAARLGGSDMPLKTATCVVEKFGMMSLVGAKFGETG